MKNFLFIIGLLLGLFFYSSDGYERDAVREGIASAEETIMEERNSADAQRRFEVLSNELKSCQCLTPRRVSTSTSSSFSLRSWKIMEKSLQVLRLRSENRIHRVSQQCSMDLGILVSTLYCRMGTHLFSLRRLII